MTDPDKIAMDVSSINEDSTVLRNETEESNFNIYVLGDPHITKALLTKDKKNVDFVEIDHPSFYGINAYWKNLPVIYNAYTRVEALSRCLSFALGLGQNSSFENSSNTDNLDTDSRVKADEAVDQAVALDAHSYEAVENKIKSFRPNVVDLSKDLKSKFLEVDRWVLKKSNGSSDEKLYCKKTIARAMYPESEDQVSDGITDQGSSGDDGYIKSKTIKDKRLESNNILSIYNITYVYQAYGLDKKSELLKSAELIVLRSDCSLLLKGPSSDNETTVSNLIADSGDLAKKTVLILTVESLRRYGFNIRKGLSWEQLFRETLNELKSDKRLHGYACIIILYNYSGALVWSPEARVFSIAYMPREIESSFEQQLKTLPFSLNSIIQAIITYAISTKRSLENTNNQTVSDRCVLYQDPEFCNWAIRIVACALGSCRQLMRDGFPAPNKDNPVIEANYAEIIKKVQEFIIEEEKRKKVNGTPSDGYHRFSVLDIGNDMLAPSFSLFDHLIGQNDIYNIACTYAKSGDLYEKEEQNLFNGVKLPYFEMGNVKTFEPSEVESFNNLKNLLFTYKGSYSAKPLSICVFGNPGAGKSFTIMEIAKGLGYSSKEFLEFNLSQMNSYDDLIKAFLQIEAVCVKGSVPIAFFDEFDSSLNGSINMGWLKYFLSPMQDGKYDHDGRTSPLGKAVFVFAGGTCSNHIDFMQMAMSQQGAKARDFLSRINAYIDVVGINKYDSSNRPPYFKRAVLLRSALLRKLAVSSGDNINKLEIDDRVLAAFLKTEEYYHDARSLTSIIETSNIAFDTALTPACIENNCLDLHVPSSFRNLLNGQ